MPEAYNYYTTSDDDPRNLVLLCTTQEMALQQDGKRVKSLYHNVKEEDGSIHRYWLEAESSSHKVGGSQVEGKEEKEDSLERGKATSSVIGTKAIGTRFNVLMTNQVTLKQREMEYGNLTLPVAVFTSLNSAYSQPMLYPAIPPMFKLDVIRRKLWKKIASTRKGFCSQSAKRHFRLFLGWIFLQGTSASSKWAHHRNYCHVCTTLV